MDKNEVEVIVISDESLDDDNESKTDEDECGVKTNEEGMEYNEENDKIDNDDSDIKDDKDDREDKIIDKGAFFTYKYDDTKDILSDVEEIKSVKNDSESEEDCKAPAVKRKCMTKSSVKRYYAIYIY